MKCSIILGRAVLALSLAVALGYGTVAENASAETGNAYAEVVTPLTVTADATRELNFGKFGPTASGTQTIIISAADPTVVTGTLTPPPVAPTTGSIGPGKFDVTGTAGLAYDVTVTPGVLTRVGGGGETMAMSAPTTDHTDGVDLTTDPSFYVGMTLTVGDDTANPDGLYEGTYQVTIVASP